MMTVWERVLENSISATRGTISYKMGFNPQADAEALMEAMIGLGTSENVLINILTQRSNAQRQIICKAYEETVGRSLKCDLEGDTVGAFEDLLVALITPPAEYDHKEVTKAIKGSGTRECILTEIFASRTLEEIKALNVEYVKEFERLLIHDLRKEISGDYSEALFLLVQAKREDSLRVDMGKARQDAEALYDATEKKLGTDEETVINILCLRSFPQLIQTLIEYRKVSGMTLQKTIEGETSGPLEDLLVAIVKCVKSTPAYFAELLRKCMKGGGTDEETLIRIMVSRSEIDLMDIRAEFKELYGHSLHSALESDLSGDFGDCLLAICGGDD